MPGSGSVGRLGLQTGQEDDRPVALKTTHYVNREETRLDHQTRHQPATSTRKTPALTASEEMSLEQQRRQYVSLEKLDPKAGEALGRKSPLTTGCGGRRNRAQQSARKMRAPFGLVREGLSCSTKPLHRVITSHVSSPKVVTEEHLLALCVVFGQWHSYLAIYVGQCSCT